MDTNRLPERRLRDKLVETALAWEGRFGVAPAVTSAISEYDAAMLVGMTEDDYATGGKERTAVSRGWDFLYRGCRYQVKANRPSGKPGSRVTLVAKAKNLEWDRLIWILYDRSFVVAEAWEWPVEQYREQIDPLKRVSPAAMRFGVRLPTGTILAPRSGS